MDGETDEECAIREVMEETGFRCEIGRELKSVSYIDRRGRHKIVRYWEMSAVGGSFTPNSEVDRIVWATPAKAARRLSYPHDRELLDQIAGAAND
jgi:8-oxo-dGTP diphosphatase